MLINLTKPGVPQTHRGMHHGEIVLEYTGRIVLLDGVALIQDKHGPRFNHSNKMVSVETEGASIFQMNAPGFYSVRMKFWYPEGRKTLSVYRIRSPRKEAPQVDHLYDVSLENYPDRFESLHPRSTLWELLTSDQESLCV